MTASYTVKLPDGNEYGPVDLATLRSWHDEGRIGPDTWVWPEGSPEWLTLMDVLAGAGQGDESEVTVPLKLKPSDTNPRGLRPAAQAATSQAAGAHPGPHATSQAAASHATARRALVTRSSPPHPVAAGGSRRVVLALGALGALLAVALAALFWWLPRWQKQEAGQRIQGDASAEGRYRDDAAGLALSAPEGWVLLRPDSTVLVAPQARAKLAQSSLGGFAVLTVEAVPPGVMTLDAFIDRVVDGRRALITDYKDLGRAEAKLGALPARRLTASWVEERTEQRVTMLAAQDAWNYVAITAWGPAAAARLAPEIDALARGVSLSGALGARVKEAVDALEPENPELSRASLDLLARDRLGNGGTAEEVSGAAVRAMSQGLAALTHDETQELQQIYAQVYDPMPEADRVRLANYQRQLKAGQPAAPEEAQVLRTMLRDALMTLPEEVRQRLQALNEKVIAASYALR